jgi:FkbM family methyltransferase
MLRGDAGPVQEPSALDRLLGQVLRGHAALVRRFGSGGLGRTMTLTRRLRGGGGLFCVQLNSDSRFIFPLGDVYWTNGLVRRRSEFEPDIKWLLRRAKDVPYVMLDCGANMGYWSVLASGAAFGSHPVVAIEASRATVELLVNNASANGGRFKVVHRALASVSGKTVQLWGSKHAGRSLRSDWSSNAGGMVENVETITLDDAVSQYFPGGDRPVLIKLDVEGVETEAMMGGRRLLGEGALVVYEDHGKDATHSATRYVLGLGEMSIWSLDDDERLISIESADQLTAIKTDPITGYNFFAYRQGSPWAQLFPKSNP